MTFENNTPPTGSKAIIRGAKVWLRALERSDMEAYKAAITDVDVAYWAGYGAPLSTDKVQDWYQDRVRAQHGKDAYYFAICPLGSDEFMGTIWLWNFDTRIGGAELSLFVADPSRWGTGAGTDAVNALLDFAFGFLNIQRIWLTTTTANERAKRSYEKSGFVLEGKIRGHLIRRGEILDSHLMSILRSDWQAQERLRSWEY